MGEERLPQRMMFGDLVGGKSYSGEQEKDWMAHLKGDMLGIGNKLAGWRKDARRPADDSTSRGESRVVHAELA